jgi:hypothetical protein
VDKSLKPVDKSVDKSGLIEKYFGIACQPHAHQKNFTVKNSIDHCLNGLIYGNSTLVFTKISWFSDHWSMVATTNY